MNQPDEPTGKTALPAGLYLVATPIGNLRDMTHRAIETLAAADVILCEDTRISARLLQAYGIHSRKLEIYNDHSAARARPKILKALGEGQSVALISDAGTPLISDPGYKLVREAKEKGIAVTALPGANAVLTALQLSGLPSDKFSFLGFLPHKSAARRDVLRVWADVPGTLVVYEAAPRLTESLHDMAEILGDREAAVARELTKMFEEIRNGTLSAMAAHYAQSGAPRGEIVIVIAPPEARAYTVEDIDSMLRGALEKMSVKDAAAFVAEGTGRKKRDIYNRALALAGRA